MNYPYAEFSQDLASILSMPERSAIPLDWDKLPEKHVWGLAKAALKLHYGVTSPFAEERFELCKASLLHLQENKPEYVLKGLISPSEKGFLQYEDSLIRAIHSLIVEA